MEDIQENEDTPHPDHYDPFSHETVELRRRIGKLHDMIDVLYKKDSDQYWEFKRNLESESGNDPRYAKLLEATSDLISKALLVRPN